MSPVEKIRVLVADVIIFSELEGLSLGEECLRHGADSFVSKNQLPEKLLVEIRRLFA